MSAYAIAHVQSVTPGPEIAEYLLRIDATLAPFKGRFLVHGGSADVREGDFHGDLIVIEFPDQHNAAGWYESAVYREIIAIRTANTTWWVVLIAGTTTNHLATDVLTGARNTRELLRGEPT